MNLLKHIKSYDALLNFAWPESYFHITICGKEIFCIEIHFSTYVKIFHPIIYVKDLVSRIKKTK